MKTTIIALVCSLASLIISTDAEAGGPITQGLGMPAYSNFYAGGSVGIANQSEFDDGTNAVGKLYGGVRLNRIMGIEAGYTKLGEVESTGLDHPGGRLPANLKSDTSGLYAAGVGYMPISHRMELMGKAGVIKWDQDNQKDIVDIKEVSSSNDSGVSPLLGVGAQYHLNQNMQIRGEWEHAFNTGEADEYKTDLDMLSVGVTFSSM